ncbi:MAG: O-acetylhomoserine aminocarboxypropyltransferase [Alphaproteobacteria bacterium]|jgi:O-acetylhomoserine (thiol)-lyase
MSETEQEPEPYGFATLAVHAGARPDPTTGARSTPIFQTNAYVFQDTDHAAELFNLQTFGFIYSRLTNPTVSVLEERVCALENGRGAVACASGHAAQFLIAATLLDVGDEFIASTNLYGGSITQFGISFKKLGWNCNFVDMTDPDNLRAAMNDKIKFIFCEILANPGGVVLDLAALAEIAKEWGVPLVVDNTLATPYLCRPFDWGADIVVHSATKYIGGHGNTMAGVVAESGRFDWNQNDKFPSMTQPDPAYHGLTFAETFGDFGFSMKMRAVALRDFGPTLSAQSAWNILQGVETLPLRMERHCTNAQAVAEFLSEHPKVAWVSYAGLPDNPYHELANKYLPKGAGAVFTFGIKGGFAAGETVVNGVNMLSHLANVGDTRSLILHPASTTHRQLTPEQREDAGAGMDVIRLSIGIETPADIMADLDQALAQT